jgi:choline dehydrogenase
VVENGRAVAVDYLEHGRSLRRLEASAGIVVAAGSIGSPHLLMLSGIGPADHLAAHGIDVDVDNPDVGSHLQYHYSQDGVFRRLTDPAAILGPLPESFDAAVEEFEATGGGWLATMLVDAVAFHSVNPGSEYPHFQSIFRPPSRTSFERTGGSIALE